MSTSLSATHYTVAGQLRARQAALGLSDQELSEAVGFERGIILTLIQQGNMKLPLTKVLAFAAALQLDPVELTRAVLQESDPALGRVIDEVFNPLRLTATEVNLIKHLRELSGDRPGAPIVFQGKAIIALVGV